MNARPQLPIPHRQTNRRSLEDANGNGCKEEAQTDLAAGDSDSDGVSDSWEVLLGRSPLAPGATNDFNGILNLRTFTPLR